MEKDPATVARLARKKADENWRFRAHVKHIGRLSGPRLNALAEELGRAAEAEMDCTTCGACCRENHIPLDEDEVHRLSARLALPVLDFRQVHMDRDDDGRPALRATPCPFLEESRCGIYADRPEACRGYPYLGMDVRKDFVGLLERAETCPIVYEMIEQLKTRLGFRRD